MYRMCTGQRVQNDIYNVLIRISNLLAHWEYTVLVSCWDMDVQVEAFERAEGAEIRLEVKFRLQVIFWSQRLQIPRVPYKTWLSKKTETNFKSFTGRTSLLNRGKHMYCIITFQKASNKALATKTVTETGQKRSLIGIEPLCLTTQRKKLAYRLSIHCSYIKRAAKCITSAPNPSHNNFPHNCTHTLLIKKT